MALADQLQQLATLVGALERDVQALRRENRRLKLRVAQLERPSGTGASAQSTAISDPWAVLGIPKGSDTAAVMQAFRNLSKRHHPDVDGGDRDLFEKLVQARDTLLSPR